MEWPFPQTVAARDEQAEERDQIDLMIALDNWRWMPACPSSLLAGGKAGPGRDEVYQAPSAEAIGEETDSGKGH
jgi:hypothetical protein